MNHLYFIQVKTKYANQTDDWPDVEFYFLSGTPLSDDGDKLRYTEGLSPFPIQVSISIDYRYLLLNLIFSIEGFTDYVWDNYYAPILPKVLKKDTWQVLPMLLRPLSRGTIRLASADPFDTPLMDPQYLSNIQDVKVLIEGIKIGLALAKTEAFQKIGTQFYNATFPGCEGIDLWTDDYWECCIRHYSAARHHQTGTCKMGPSTDLSAVVDPELKVYNINGLRVADASIMPYVPSGNINAPTV